MFFGIIFLLFTAPIIIEFFSNSTQQEVNSKQPSGEPFLIAEVPEEKQLFPTYQNHNRIEQTPQNKTALFLFTHSHEAFEPIVKSKNGMSAVYHPTTNITQFKDTIVNHFDLNSIKTEFLAVDTMGEMKKNNRSFAEAYDVVRPFLATELQKKEYDLIIDLHRDSATRKITSLTFNNQSYAKLYFVVGENNPNSNLNKSYAEHLSTHLNELVPGISRGIIGKKGVNVDGNYNQDLAENMVLIELGGIGNTQDEINRTISVLAHVISMVLNEIPL